MKLADFIWKVMCFQKHKFERLRKEEIVKFCPHIQLQRNIFFHEDDRLRAVLENLVAVLHIAASFMPNVVKLVTTSAAMLVILHVIYRVLIMKRKIHLSDFIYF